MRIAEFSIAVVDDDKNLRFDRLCGFNSLTDLFGRQRFADRIAFGALNENDFDRRFVFQKGAHFFEIDFSVRRHFLRRIFHAEIGKRAVSGLTANADDLFECVIRLAGDREKRVARAQKPEKRHR